MKTLCRMSFVTALLLCATAAHAQGGTIVSTGGCSQSPENPTVILSLLGTGGFVLAATRHRIRARFGKQKRG